MKHSHWIGCILVACLCAAFPGSAGSQGSSTETSNTTAPSWGSGMGMGGGSMMGRGMMGQGMMAQGMMDGSWMTHMMGSGPAGHGMMMMRRLWSLDLDSDQQEKIRAIHVRTQKKAIPLEADLRVQLIDLKELMLAESPSMQAVESQIQQMNDVREKLQVMWAQALIESRGVLTADQLAQFRDMAWHPYGGSGSRSSSSETQSMPHGGMHHRSGR